MNVRLGKASIAGLVVAGNLLVAPTAAVADTGPPATSYPIPDGAIFVSAKSGNDTAPGTEKEPLRTAKAALKKAKAGDTIVLREGEYRESLGSIAKRVTLQPYPRETVWFKGSTVVGADRFTADGGDWRLDGWDPDICRPGADLKACVHPDDITAGNEIGGDPEMVFVDGRPVTQVASRDKVTTGTFYWDSTRDRLYLGTDPSGRKVEIASVAYALHFLAGSEKSVVRGLGFAHYATSQDYTKKPAALISQASGVTFEKNVVSRNAAAGIAVHAADNRLIGNTVESNGFLGVASNKAARLLMEGNRILANNQEKMGLVSSASLAGAGMKATYLRDSVIRDNVFSGNLGAGFWCDLSCAGVTLVRNLAQDNTKAGLYYEVSADGLIASNVLTGNGQYGLKISGSNKVRVYNNTMAGNAQAIMVAEDPRPHLDRCSADNCPTDADRALGNTWDTRDLTLINNLFAGGTATTPLFDTLDGNSASSGKRVGAPGMIPASRMDHNGYHRAAAGTPPTLVKWTGADGKTTLHTALRTLTADGREAHAVYQEGAAIFATKDGYTLKTDSPFAKGGQPLPADVAAAIGTEAGVPVPIGALSWPSGTQPLPDTTPSPTPTPTSTPTSSDVAAAMTRPVHHLRRQATGETLLTLSDTERAKAVSTYGYTSLGTAFRASAKSGENLVPVYRLRHSDHGDRIFTRSASERDNAIAKLGYVSEGTAFHASARSGQGLVAVYRLQKGRYHTYAVGTTARDTAQKEGWKPEHVAFYARPA